MGKIEERTGREVGHRKDTNGREEMKGDRNDRRVERERDETGNSECE